MSLLVALEEALTVLVEPAGEGMEAAVVVAAALFLLPPPPSGDVTAVLEAVAEELGLGDFAAAFVDDGLGLVLATEKKL